MKSKWILLVLFKMFKLPLFSRRHFLKIGAQRAPKNGFLLLYPPRLIRRIEYQDQPNQEGCKRKHIETGCEVDHNAPIQDTGYCTPMRPCRDGSYDAEHKYDNTRDTHCTVTEEGASHKLVYLGLLG